VGSQGGEGGGHVVGEWGVEVDRLAGDRVFEVQRVSVEGLTIEEDGRGFGVIEAEKVAESERASARIRLIGEDRMADVGQVDADLVGPTGLRLTANQGVAVEAFEHLVERHGFLASVLDRSDGHFLAVDWVHPERLLDEVAVSGRHPVNQGEIFLADRPLLELFGQELVSLVVLGDDQEARGVAVEPMNDPRAVVAADRGKRVEMKLEGVD
jgi:hypothetical protein